MRNLRTGSSIGALAFASVSLGQIPDLMNAFDVGGRAMGAGGALYGNEATTLSTHYNPAGLGYLEGPEVGIAYRNLPTSRSRITGTYREPVRDSQGVRGQNAVTHAGYAVPLSQFRRGASGNIAFSYTLGGYMSDRAVGPNSGLPDGTGTFNINGFREEREAKADFYTIAYGKTNASQTFSFGIGLTFLQQRLSFSQSGSSSVGFEPFDFSSTGSGVGVIAGVQYTPPQNPTVSFGASVRTPIDLSGNEQTSAFYDRVPGRFLLSGAMRRDGFRGGRDFLVIGTQLETFFGGRGDYGFNQSGQTVFGIGAEYSYEIGNARIPLRVGYRAVPAGGDIFGARNTLTYGFGYRPSNNRFAIDFNWAAPRGGGYDFAITATYRLR